MYASERRVTQIKLCFVLTLALLLSGGALHASSAPYTLYYLDVGHNVCRVDDRLERQARGTGRMTQLGGYDAYSVSPDEKYVAGIRDQGGRRYKPGFLWRYQLELASGRPLKWVLSEVCSDGEPKTLWSRNGKLMIVSGAQVDYTTYVYSLEDSKLIFKTDDHFGPMSSDERYVLLCRQEASCDDGPIQLSVLDLGSAMAAPAIKVDPDKAQLWLGDTHTFAAVGADGNAWVCDVSRGRGGVPELSGRAVTSAGDITGLSINDGVLHYAGRAAPSSEFKIEPANTIQFGSHR